MFKNSDELNGALLIVLNDVISNVSDRIIGLLQDNIKKFATAQGSDWYQKTGEFEAAFKWNDIKASLNSISREMIYDWETMTFDPKKFIHGSPWGGDARQNLWDILNVSGPTSSLLWKYSMPYLDITISWLTNGGWLELFRQELQKSGLNIL